MFAVQRLEPLSARPSPSTRQADRGSAKPLSRCGPRSASSKTPYQPPGRLADHDIAWHRKRLQSSCQVGRITDHRLLLGRARSHQLADHDQTGRDADPGRQVLSCRGVELPGIR
jgi:hypothetical protein